MSTPRKRSKISETAEVKAFRKSLLEDAEYLAELDEALEAFQDGESKTLEEIETSRRQREIESNH